MIIVKQLFDKNTFLYSVSFVFQLGYALLEQNKFFQKERKLMRRLYFFIFTVLH